MFDVLAALSKEVEAESSSKPEAPLPTSLETPPTFRSVSRSTFARFMPKSPPLKRISKGKDQIHES